jgi:N-acylneuraminate cytidylyltransferase
MGNICIIPARGGSKRIPRKNIKYFLGKPIIAYSIQAALDSLLFDEVMVSTDDSEIAKIAVKYGAKVPFKRSDKNSDDFATTFDVIEEVIISYKNEGREFDNVCCLYACAPFVTKELILESFQKLKSNNFDTVFPVIPYSFPIQRALIEKNGKIFMIKENNLQSRTQDLEKTYHDVGQFYCCKIDRIMLNKKILTNNTGGIFVTELDAQDIDNHIDWKLAELKYSLRNEL